MKHLLIVTQAVDTQDSILGFFHRWIEKFAQECSSVSVIGQRVGQHTLPKNVQVLSLEKEKNSSRISQVFRFWSLIIQHRTQYDVVLVHMTPIWIVLGAPVWLLLRKRMYLWYEARGGGWPLTIALWFVRKVFSASAHGMPRSTRKSTVVGHGIDTDQFRPADIYDENLLVTVGRITPAKRIDFLVSQFLSLPARLRMVIVGKPITTADREYADRVHAQIRRANAHDRITLQPMQHDALREVLQRAAVFVHASDTGLDKVVLEAMACGCPVVSSGRAFHNVLPMECWAGEANFAERIQEILSLSPEQRSVLGASLRKIIEDNHSLPRLIQRLAAEMF